MTKIKRNYKQGDRQEQVMENTTQVKFGVAAFCERYAAEIRAINMALVTDFNTPAQRSINAGFARMGVQRFVGKDDRWEQITAHQNGWDYEPPPAHLARRWASY